MNFSAAIPVKSIKEPISGTNNALSPTAIKQARTLGLVNIYYPRRGYQEQLQARTASDRGRFVREQPLHKMLVGLGWGPIMLFCEAGAGGRGLNYEPQFRAVTERTTSRRCGEDVLSDASVTRVVLASREICVGSDPL